MAMDPKTREQMAGSAGIRDHKRFTDDQLRQLKATQGRTRQRLMKKFLSEGSSGPATSEKPKARPKRDETAPSRSTRTAGRPAGREATPEAARTREAHGRDRVERDMSTSPRPRPRPEESMDNSVVNISRDIMGLLPPEEQAAFLEKAEDIESTPVPAERMSRWFDEVFKPLISRFRYNINEGQSGDTLIGLWSGTPGDQATPGAMDDLEATQAPDSRPTVGQTLEEDRNRMYEGLSMFPRDHDAPQYSYKKGGFVKRRGK